MSTETEQPEQLVSTWWFDRDHDNADVDGYINGDIGDKAREGYRLVSITPLPMGKECAVVLHFKKGLGG